MREADIRPKELLDEYLRLSARDARELFSDGDRADVSCVACGHGENTFQFSKNGFAYGRCNSCGTLFQTPRPGFAAFEKFYVNSASSEFWAKEFFPKVAAARRKSIFAPRATALADILTAKNFNPKVIADVGAGHGVFLSELSSKFNGVECIAIEPSAEMAKTCRSLGFDTHESLAEEVSGLDGAADLTCCLEVIEHVHNPLAFLSQLVRFTKPDGWVFFTTLGADGFDIQVLGAEANAVFPPHHLNFMSIKGFEILCQRAGLTDIEITTPGKLDVDIVINKLAEKPEIDLASGFLQSILNDTEKSAAFQKFLAANRLSSHTWVLARVKP